MKKLELKEKVNLAYYRATGEDGGWEMFLDMIYKNTQEEIAHKFGVTLATSHRWHKAFKQLERVPQ